MRNIFISLVFVLIIKSIQGQHVPWEWYRSFGNNGADEITCSTLDYQKNSYIAGYFYEQLDLDHIKLTAHGEYDGFIAKIDNNGKVIWAKNFGGSYIEDNVIPDYPTKIFIDKNSNIFLIGYIHSCDNIDSIKVVNSRSSDIFITKLNPSGKTFWAMTLENAGSEVLSDVIFDGDNIYISGTCISVDSSKKYRTLTFLNCITSSGNKLWSNTLEMNYISSKISKNGTNVILELKKESPVAQLFDYISFIYTSSGDLICSSENDPKHYKKSTTATSLDFIAFDHDTTICDSSIFFQDIWKSTAIISEKNEVEEIISGKVINSMICEREQILVGNDIVEPLYLNINSSFLDFFIGKRLKDVEKDEITEGQDILVYPNPSTEEFNIIFSGKQDMCDLAIYNSCGDLIDIITSANLPYKLSIEQRGIYFLRLTIDGKFYIKKLSKV